MKLLDESLMISLTEISDACGVHCEFIVEMVNHGIVEPIETTQPWQFQSHSITRVQKALRLHQDLKINLAGIALSLQLLDEIDDMRVELATLRKHLLEEE